MWKLVATGGGGGGGGVEATLRASEVMGRGGATAAQYEYYTHDTPTFIIK